MIKKWIPVEQFGSRSFTSTVWLESVSDIRREGYVTNRSDSTDSLSASKSISLAGTAANRTQRPIRPRVEIVWARQELERLDLQIERAERDLSSNPIPFSPENDSWLSAVQQTQKDDLRRLIRKKRKLVRWLIGVGEEVSSSDRAMATVRPSSKGTSGSRRKSPKKKQVNQPRAGKNKVGKEEKPVRATSSKQRKKSKTRKKHKSVKLARNVDSGVWPGGPNGTRRRARFIS